MKYLDQIPTQEWVERRKSSLGGSEIAAVLGKSQFTTPLRLWMIKQGLLEPSPSTAVTEFGNVFEPVMAEKFQQLTGLKTRNLNKQFVHPQHGYLKGNIDRQILGGEFGTGLLELKTTTSYRLKHLSEPYPVEWDYQIQFYLGLTGYQYAYLFIYERDTAEFHPPVLIKRNDVFIRRLMDGAVQWWTRHMVEGVRPDPINGEDRLILYPESTSKTSEATPKAMAYYNEVMDLRERMARLESLEEHYTNLLKDQLEDAERLVHSGKTLVSWKTVQATRLDSTRLKTEQPEVYQQFAKTSESRRFMVYKQKEAVCL